MEIRAGLEPVIAAVKGLCPNLLDERTIGQGRGPCDLCNDEDIIDANM